MRVRTIFFLLCITLLIPPACSNKKKGTEPDPETPFPCAVPPLATMQVDTSELDQGGAIEGSEFCHGSSRPAVLWIDAVLVFPLAIPVGAFNACILRDPVYLGNETWQWTASGGSGSQQHADELTARILGDGEVAWSLRISGTQHDLRSFLWVDGVCDTAATSGSWHFYDRRSRTIPREQLRIDWTVHRLLGGSAELLLESTDAQADQFGDRLLYETSAVVGAATFLDRDDLGIDTLRLRWSWLDGSGMAVAAGDTCCWGERPLYGDIACP